MKILFFIDAFNAGGKERRLVELMKGLKNNTNLDFELVVMNKEIHYKEVIDLGIRIHYIIRKAKKDISIFKKVYRLCKEIKPDIVHTWDSMTSIYVIPSIKLLGIKYINGMVVDAPQQQNIGNRNWLRAKIAFPFSHLIIGNSKAGLFAYKAPENKSVCIYNGFNFSRIKQIKEPEVVKNNMNISSPNIVGMVASFSEYKDYKTYFEAATILLKKRTDICFLAIGDNTDSDFARQMIDDEFADHFILLGKKTEIESYINVMDICVLSTFTEGISNAILEYMALGKPVIATDGGGTNEIVEDGITGFLVPQLDPAALANKLELLIVDKNLRLKTGMAGKKRIETIFSINRMIKEYRINYKKLTN